MENETVVEETTLETTDSPNGEVVEAVEETVEADPYAEKTIEDYKALEQKNKELYARAKKAEEEAKKIKSPTLSAEVKKSNTDDSFIREELYLIAQGEKPEVVEEAKIVALARNIPLKEALEYPTIKSFKDSIIAKEKSEKASLSPSGANVSQGINPLEIVGETKEEHQARFEKELKARGLK